MGNQRFIEELRRVKEISEASDLDWEQRWIFVKNI